MKKDFRPYIRLHVCMPVRISVGHFVCPLSVCPHVRLFERFFIRLYVCQCVQPCGSLLVRLYAFWLARPFLCPSRLSVRMCRIRLCLKWCCAPFQCFLSIYLVVKETLAAKQCIGSTKPLCQD